MGATKDVIRSTAYFLIIKKMAYQKLQAGRAWSVNTSDNTDIPDIGTAGPTGTTTSGSATQLIDNTATFLTNGVARNDCR